MLISAWPETSDRAPKVIRKVLIEVVTVSEKLGQVSLGCLFETSGIAPPMAIKGRLKLPGL